MYKLALSVLALAAVAYADTSAVVTATPVPLVKAAVPVAYPTYHQGVYSAVKSYTPGYNQGYYPSYYQANYAPYVYHPYTNYPSMVYPTEHMAYPYGQQYYQYYQKAAVPASSYVY